MAMLTSSQRPSGSQHVYHQEKKGNFCLLCTRECHTVEGTLWLFSLLVCTFCIRLTVNLVCIRCTKQDARNEYKGVEHLVHEKTSPAPAVVRGCFIPSRIILISLPSPIFCLLLDSRTGCRFHPFTIFIT